MDKITAQSLLKQDTESVLRLNLDWTEFKNKTFLITGATGLVGSCLVDMLLFLNREFRLNLKLVLIARHKKEYGDGAVVFIEHDISRALKLDCRIDFIIHAASNTHPVQYSQYPIETIMTNLLGSYNLLELAVKNLDCRLLFCSSVEIYGDDTDNLEDGFKENDFGYLDCNTARASYSESKRVCESLMQSYISQKDVDCVIARLCRIYGPTVRKDDSKVVNQFFRNALNGEDIVLKSNGFQYYSYLYSADAASAIILLLLKGKNGEAYNVSAKSSNISLKELASIIATTRGRSVVFDVPNEVELKGFSKSQRAILDSSKLNALGWSALLDIQSGVERTLKIMGDRNNAIDTAYIKTGDFDLSVE